MELLMFLSVRFFVSYTVYSFKCFSNVDTLFRFDLRGSCGGSRGGSLSVSPFNRSRMVFPLSSSFLV